MYIEKRIGVQRNYWSLYFTSSNPFSIKVGWTGVYVWDGIWKDVRNVLEILSELAKQPQLIDKSV